MKRRPIEMSRRTAVFLVSLLSGCASLTVTTPPGASPSPPVGRYEVASGRDAATVAELRAAPAPATPELIQGKSNLGDRRQLAAQGYVHVGTAWFPASDEQARDDAIRQGQTVGADKVLLYGPTKNANGNAEWVATYYVRFQLPFGATFRDLRASERKAVHGSGGIAIGTVIGGTPASRANLRTGDLVLELDREPVTDRGQFAGLLKRHAGRHVTLTLVRNGVTLKREIWLGSVASATEH